MQDIKVVDLFAGAGGLGEGFSSFSEGNCRPFKIALSIEKDLSAYETLLLRSFFNKFEPDSIPAEYFAYLNNALSKDELFNKYPKQRDQALQETQCIELGKTSSNYVNDLVKQRIGKSKDWVLTGGPPCQAYSVVGRSRMKSTNPNFEKDERHFLYIQYLKILAVHQPPVFLIENVRGMLSAMHSGIKMIDKILHDLKNPFDVEKPSNSAVGYRLFSLVDNKNNGIYNPEDFLVKAENYGIPQCRHRVLILGIRNDIDITPEILARKNPPSVSDVISDLPRIRSGLSKEKDSIDRWIDVLKGIKNEPWYIKGKTNGLADIIENIDTVLDGLNFEEVVTGSEVMNYNNVPNAYPEWYRRSCNNFINGHITKSHMQSDLYRYLFSSVYAKKNNKSAQLQDFPDELLPDHSNINGKHFSDRFRVQLADKPSTTITSHIAKDGHYFIHYDPVQCRSLSIREAARLQTFPDNYKFEGSRTSQFQQIGNAVPPLLSRQVAEIIYDIFLQMRN